MRTMVSKSNSPDVIFWRGLFSEVFWKVRDAVTRFIVVYGGASASKSWSVMQQIVMSTTESPNNNWLIVRKYYSDIQESCYRDFMRVASMWGWGDRFIFRQSPLGIICKETGARVVFKGMDDPEKVKSISGIKYVFIEEANQLEFDDFRELNRRIRGQEGTQIYLVFNPVVITHWLKEELFDKPYYQDHTTYIHATYKDAQKWLTEDDIIQLEMLKDINPNDYKVYCLGEWGKVRTGNEFYYNFVYTKHIGYAEPVKGKPLHISFDQNVVPYITCIVSQIVEDDNGVYNLNVLDELCLKNPLNNTEALCREFVREWGDYLDAGLFYYGDATGRKRDTRGTENDYDIVERVLGKYLTQTSCRVPYNNPLITKRRDFINRILSNKFNIRLKINPDCKNLITDIEMVQEDAEGKKFKKKKSDRDGASYEELGHCFIGSTIVDGKHKIKSIKPGMKLSTGTVKKVHYNGIREVRTFQIGVEKITCTPDHLFIIFNNPTHQKEIINLCGMENDFIIKDNKEWKREKLFTKDLNSAAIQTLKDYQTVDILRDGLKRMARGLRSTYTALFGSGILVKYRMAIIFTILMAILTTMQLITWSAFQVLTTFLTTVKIAAMRLKSFALKPYRIIEIKLLNGMVVMRAANGIEITGNAHSNMRRRGNAGSAGWNSSPKLRGHISVAENASVGFREEFTEQSIILQRSLPVKFVAKSLNHCQKMLADFAAGRVIKHHAKVYDITMDKQPVYFANGVLVHNCSDALEYLIMSAFENYIQLI